MGKFNTKEDDVSRISISIYVTNFPEGCSAKELFNACKQYGHVIDSSIPLKRSKEGKRFGFVRFINVFNVERLVNNLCTVWNDRCRLQANVARFQREPLSSNLRRDHVRDDRRRSVGQKPSVYGANSGNEKTFANVVKNSSNRAVEEKEVVPTMVLDDECVKERDFSTSLIGRVKTFSSLTNIQKTLCNEGFTDFTFKYMG
ncbi:nucleotide-binding alpha-beta plait domain-containing protein [Artemisia annua]|uniref:Nucleotide-binding alpha-beta plait domain-containing protein n=1 Tax=Artemisia annua TaxID=35608 RepID=A0A2U1KW01_ARTAN|nr:nucleotide-binding alpha-beta plait domain-containing protein [Artemisia annua]